jgi:hypothetical protein
MPVERTQKKNKTIIIAAETKAKIKTALQKLSVKKHSEKVQKNIAKLKTAFEKKDEKLEKTNLNEKIDEMKLNEIEDSTD